MHEISETWFLVLIMPPKKFCKKVEFHKRHFKFDCNFDGSLTFCHTWSSSPTDVGWCHNHTTTRYAPSDAECHVPQRRDGSDSLTSC